MDYPNDRVYFTSNFSFYLKMLALHHLYSNKLSYSKDDVKKQQLEVSTSPSASLVLSPKISY